MKRVDMFGGLILLRFQGKPIHKTNFGGVLTIALISIIFTRFSIMVKNSIEGQNPTLLFQERLTVSHKKFTILPNTFTLAIGMQNSTFQYYLDETYFFVEGKSTKKKLVFNNSTNQFETTWESFTFQLEVCTKDHIYYKYTLDFYEKAQLQSHYCLPKNLELEIEGEFNSDLFSTIYIYLKRCQGNHCQPPDAIDQLLNNNFIEVLFSDVYVSQEDKKYPFKHFARDLYWAASQKLPQHVNIYLRNNNIETDIGLFQSNIQEDIYPSFSYSEAQLVHSSNDYFFSIELRFEKQKENYYRRQYQSLISMISEIGGFSQILMAISLLISSAYSNISLNQALINKTFNFQEYNSTCLSLDQSLAQSHLKKQQTFTQNRRQTIQITSQETEFIQNTKGNKKKKQTKSISSIFENSKLKNRLPVIKSPLQSQVDQFDSYLKQDNINLDPQVLSATSVKTNKNLSNKNSVIYKNPISKLLCQANILNSNQNTQTVINMSNNNQSDFKKEKTENKMAKEVQNQFQKLLNKSTNSMEFSILNYFLSFFCCVKRLRQKKKILKYSINKLYERLDVSFIINKMIEVDKLKKIFLDDDQIQLMEYLPKPQITYQFLENEEVKMIDDKNEIFNMSNRSDFDKMTGAIQSLKNIMNKEKLTKIDKNIILQIDSKFNDIFSDQLENIDFDKLESPNFSPLPKINIIDDSIQEGENINQQYKMVESPSVNKIIKSHILQPKSGKNMFSDLIN